MRFTDKVSLLPLHAQAHLYLDGITVAKVIQAGLDKTFPIDRVLIVIPAISSSEPHAAPDTIIAAGDARLPALPAAFLKKVPRCQAGEDKMDPA